VSKVNTMAKKGKDYSKMKRKDLESIAGEVGAIKDHDARLAETLKAYAGYHNSGTIDAEHRKPAMEMLNPEGSTYKDLWEKLYKPLDKEHTKEGADLAPSVTSEWVKRFADKIMPAMKSGVKGEKIHNYQTMVFYLNQFDAFQGQEEGTTISKIHRLVSQGHGAEAAATIIQAMRVSKKQHELQHFMELLMPKKQGHYDFLENAAKKIAKDTTDQYLKPRGEDKSTKISTGKIADKLTIYFQHYAAKDFQYIARNAGVGKDKKKVASPASVSGAQSKAA
jgi:hypothetical protein